MSVKSLVAAALCASVLGLSLPGAADASHRYRRHHHHHHNHAGAAVIGGLGLGIILGSAFAPRYYSPRYYDAPQVRYRYGLRPWTREWYDYCSRRYRSFNFRTGYFLGYDGRYHFCR